MQPWIPAEAPPADFHYTPIPSLTRSKAASYAGSARTLSQAVALAQAEQAGRGTPDAAADGTERTNLTGISMDARPPENSPADCRPARIELRKEMG